MLISYICDALDYKVKILVIRFSSIGDIVLTTPVIRCLKEQLEGEVEIHFLTKKQYKVIIENNPKVTKVISIEKSTSEVIANLKDERYDYIIDLHKNLRSRRVINKLKTFAFSFDKLNYKKWLLTQFKINKLPNIHIVDRYLKAAKPLGVENDMKGLEYYIPSKDEVDIAKELPSEFQSGFISIAIGAQHATKRMPTHKLIELCEEAKFPVVLLGGKEDEAEADQIKKTVGGKVYNACGKYNLNQSASFIKQSKSLVTHDTGLMHIGAAFGVKIVSVWGNTVPEFGMYPYMPEKPDNFSIIENRGLSCRPCSKIGHDQCPKKHFKCMEQLSVKEINNSLKDL